MLIPLKLPSSAGLKLCSTMNLDDIISCNKVDSVMWMGSGFCGSLSVPFRGPTAAKRLAHAGISAAFFIKRFMRNWKG